MTTKGNGIHQNFGWSLKTIGLRGLYKNISSLQGLTLWNCYGIHLYLIGFQEDAEPNKMSSVQFN